MALGSTYLYMYICLEPQFDLYFWRSTPQNKVFSNQNKGHLGSRHIYIYIFVEWYTHISHTSYMCIFNIHTPLTCNTMDTQNCQISAREVSFPVTSFSVLNFHGVHSYLHACIHAVIFIILKTSNFRRVLTRWYRVPIQHPFWAQSPPKLEDAVYTRMLYLAFATRFRTNMRTIDSCEYEKKLGKKTPTWYVLNFYYCKFVAVKHIRHMSLAFHVRAAQSCEPFHQVP